MEESSTRVDLRWWQIRGLTGIDYKANSSFLAGPEGVRIRGRYACSILEFVNSCSIEVITCFSGCDRLARFREK